MVNEKYQAISKGLLEKANKKKPLSSSLLLGSGGVGNSKIVKLVNTPISLLQQHKSANISEHVHCNH